MLTNVALVANLVRRKRDPNTSSGSAGTETIPRTLLIEPRKLRSVFANELRSRVFCSGGAGRGVGRQERRVHHGADAVLL